MKFQSTALAFVATLAFVAAEDLVALVEDILPGTASSNPSELVMFDGKVFFHAAGEGTGIELYASDGETVGTGLVKDIYPGTSSSVPQDLTVFAGKLFFSADDGTSGRELWVSDGTVDGTVLFADINPGSLSSSPSNFVVLGDYMVFEATTESFGEELWVTDGTVEGTMLLSDLQAGPDSSNLSMDPQYKIGNMTLFTADDGVNGPAIYSTDGTSVTYLTNTTMGEKIIVGRAKEEVTIGYFAIGSTFWVTDGTLDGTEMILEDVAINGASRISPYILGGKTHFFGTSDNMEGLWETDGTKNGTNILVSGLDETVDPSRGASLVTGFGFGPVLNGKISLFIENGIGFNIFVTDGEVVEPLVVEDLQSILEAELSMSGEQVIFQVNNGTALNLISSDYTDLNTVLVNSFEGTIPISTAAVAISANETLFTAKTPETGVELWRMTFPELVVVSTPTRQPVASPTRAPTAPFPSPTQPPVNRDISPATRVDARGFAGLIAILGGLVAFL